MTQSALGCRVTLKCGVFRRPCSITKKTVEQSERQRRNGEEVESDDYFAMVLEKCPPPLPCITTPPDSPQIASDSPFRNREAELQQFGMDLGRSPIAILLRQASDQLTNLRGDLRSAAACPRAPTPVEPETRAVPADDGLRLHDDKNVSPAGPTAAQGSPEESVQPVDDWRWPFAFEHRDLLPEGEGFESGITPTAKVNSER
jgi:hypothetical protein